MASSFRENLAFAIHERLGATYKDKTLAEALNVDRSTANRLRNSTTPPNSTKLESLSRYFGIPPSAWTLPTEEFIAEYNRCTKPANVPAQSKPVAIQMHAINTHRYLWTGCLNTHKGQYIAYWKASDLHNYYVASLLEVTQLTQEGLEFQLLNPYIRDDTDNDEIRIWKYQGKLYPVSDYLYFFAEQTDSNYELFSMIMTASPVTPPDILRGCMSGIHVKDGRKQIAVNIAVILLYVRKPITDWRREMGTRLGKLPAGKVPERIRKLIDPFPGVITLGV